MDGTIDARGEAASENRVLSLEKRETAPTSIAGARLHLASRDSALATAKRTRPEYVELHCHSAFSLLDGASEPEALLERARAVRMPALALTDHDELGGVVRFAAAAETLEMAGIIGAELTMREPDANEIHHLVVLAESPVGYANLSTLVTRARMDNERGRPSVTRDLLARHAAGLFALSGCPRGLVPSRIAAGDGRGARAAAGMLADIFGGRFAIECWDHGLPEERALVRALIPLARELDVPWVVTNDVHYARPDGRIVHDVLSCLRHQRTLDTMGTRLRPNGEWYLKSAAQMERRWRGDDAGLRATMAIAERCAFRMKELKPTLPEFPLPPGVSAFEYLRKLVEAGLQDRVAKNGIASPNLSGIGNRESPAPGGAASHFTPDSRFPTLDEYQRQIAHELSLIDRLDLSGYFLIVWDIVRFANREGVLCQGRGSAANSAVCYCLGITAVDPVRMGLLFERFLSEERREAPDIDIDFAHRDRERVLQYVYQRYGREHAAMVCEQITYRGRSAVRDAARVLGFSVEQANALSILSDRFSAKATGERLHAEPSDEMREASEPARNSHLGTRNSLADIVGQRMMPGTEANTRTRAMKDEARRVSPAERPLTTSDRPRPNAAYEPYGSPNARSTSSPVPPRTKTRTPHHDDGYMDPHASDTHEERRNPTTALRSSDDDHPLRAAGLDPDDVRVRALAGIVTGLHQVPRHRSIHVGGFVLTKEPLSSVVPIEPASMADRTVIQWERDDLDPVGLVKIDLLGLGMLTVLQDCLKYIRATRGVTIDLGQLDMTDQAVYDDLCRADTIGVFQVESRAQMNTLPRLKPRSFYDLVVEVAIIRPGPIQGEMVHPYLRRRAGEEKVEYPHPSLEPILKRTLGVPLFQEQGMQVAIATAGFTPGEADLLRKAMGHKRSRERMAAICEKLIEGMTKNGIAEDVARRIYNQINAFADYGFPESHAASFALIVYASAYLRHYYATEFACAMLNAQPMGFYSAGTLIEDAQRHAVEVRPVDLTRSSWDHSLELDGVLTVVPWDGVITVRKVSGAHDTSARRAPALRLGLRSIRGLGTVARTALERALHDGPFMSVDDVVRRGGLDQRSLRVLAEAGAFDAMFPDEPPERRRRAALWEVLRAVRGDAGPLAPSGRDRRRAPLPPMSHLEVTEADYRITGLSLNGHPMRHLRPLLAPNGIRTASDLHRARDGERVAHAGLVICRQRPGTAKGFVFLSLEDETGILNVVVTPKRFEKQALLISTSPLLLVRGTLQVEQNVVNLRGETFRALKADAGEDWAKRHDFH